MAGSVPVQADLLGHLDSDDCAGRRLRCDLDRLIGVCFVGMHGMLTTGRAF